MKQKAKIRIAITSRGWVGYEGTRKVKEFGFAIPGAELAAKAWKYDKLNPICDWYGEQVHPVTKEQAPEGQMWIRNMMSGVFVLTSNRTPFTQSVASESYWCQ